jgi:WD40 repeat protein
MARSAELNGWIDGHVRIWSTEAILQAGDPDYSKPKQLCHMSYHSGTIHTVRFSPNGRWLASGADDKIICIYYLDTNPPAHSVSFGMYYRITLKYLRPGTHESSRIERAPSS